MNRRKTQRERLEPLLEGLKSSREAMLAKAKAIQEIVDHARNKPPHGLSDGTVDAPLWYQARDVAAALRTLSAALSYIPCPTCKTACPTWIVQHKPCTKKRISDE